MTGWCLFFTSDLILEGDGVEAVRIAGRDKVIM